MKQNNSNIRFDLQIIASWIEPGSKVLGLGCGEGELLHFLKKNKQVTGTGIELNEDKVPSVLKKACPYFKAISTKRCLITRMTL